MEATFMTIHDLTSRANILFASESIVDILGFRPAEVTGKSCFDYFHPDEVPFARRIHNRGVMLDQAAVLHYARMQHKEGHWVGCECVFTVVYEVIVACTSIYKGDAKSQKRAAGAPAIRRLFASSPHDPRYHMLEHLSSKFRAPPQPSILEPRAALIVNRFTRTLTIMYATNAVSSILGVSSQQLKDKSLYECMQEECLPEAIRCLESAKANDSIAYLRFWYRDPRREEDFDREMHEASQSSDSEDGGVELSGFMDINPSSHARGSPLHEDGYAVDHNRSHRDNYRISSGDSTDLEQDATHAIFDQTHIGRSSSSSAAVTEARRRRTPPAVERIEVERYELEAVVSCTSDGLVVVLRRARPPLPLIQESDPTLRHGGLCAAPWGADVIRPHRQEPDPQLQYGLNVPRFPAGGPPAQEFMESIREVAVFAWALTGINGSIACYGRGTPRGEAQPPGGLLIWNYCSHKTPSSSLPQNQTEHGWPVRSVGSNDAAIGVNIMSYHHQGEETNLGSSNDSGGGSKLSEFQSFNRQSPFMTQTADANPFIPQIHYQHPSSNLPNSNLPSQPFLSEAPLYQPQDPQHRIAEGSRTKRYLWY